MTERSSKVGRPWPPEGAFARIALNACVFTGMLGG